MNGSRNKVMGRKTMFATSPNHVVIVQDRDMVTPSFAVAAEDVMALELVDPFRSELRDDLNADDEMYARLRIEASLKSSFGRLFFQETRLAPLGLR